MGQSFGQLNTIRQADMQNHGDDFSTKEKGVRLGMDALGGLGQGYQNYQNQNAALRQGGRGGAPIAIPQGPQAPQFSTQNLPGGGSGDFLARRTKNFYGA